MDAREARVLGAERARRGDEPRPPVRSVGVDVIVEDAADPGHDPAPAQRVEEPRGGGAVDGHDGAVMIGGTEVREDVANAVTLEERRELGEPLRRPHGRALLERLARLDIPGVVAQPAVLDPHAVFATVVPAVSQVLAARPKRPSDRSSQEAAVGDDAHRDSPAERACWHGRECTSLRAPCAASELRSRSRSVPSWRRHARRKSSRRPR